MGRLASTPPGGRSGFGSSSIFPMPSYQAGLNTGAMRSVPDVVANADPLTTGMFICQASAGGCPIYALHGGTSLAAPIFAALTALWNQAVGHNLGELNPQLYNIASSSPNSFHSAASMGSDFAHAGLGSPNHDAIYLALTSQQPGAVSNTLSVVAQQPDTVVLDGSSVGAVVVALLDANGNTVPGKTVSLTLSPSTPSATATITPSSATTDTANGAAVFTVTDTALGTLSFTASDTTDTLPLTQTATITFVAPPAASGGISASPLSVPADGSTPTTITVTLKDASNNPSPGKQVEIFQGNGSSTLSGTSGSTGANGQVQFTATDTVTESVTYNAVDVTDGNLPVPGSVTVNFTNGGANSCNLGLGTATSGFVVSTFASGFPLDVNNFGCVGPIGVAFDSSDNLLVIDTAKDQLYKFGPQGGAAGPSTLIGQVLPTSDANHTYGQAAGLAFGLDGELYATQVGGFEGVGGRVVQLDPATAVTRQVAFQNGFGLTDCDVGIATEPLTGDLFTSQPRCTFLGGEPNIARVMNPQSNCQTNCAVLSRYSAGLIADGLTFASDGTLYTVANGRDIYKIDGTNTMTPGTTHCLVTVPASDGIAVQPNPASPSQPFLIVNRNDGKITKLDFTQNDPSTGQPPLQTDIYTGGSRGDFVTVGPDGCLYATQTDRVIKLGNADGSCSFSQPIPQPGIVLTPNVVSPSPAQGTPVTFTAKLNNVTNPGGTYVTFSVSGVNPQLKQVKEDASGQATFTYTGILTGTDLVVATASPAGKLLTSNAGRADWGAGSHTTFVTLNTSVTSGATTTQVTLRANLSDLSATPVAGLGSKSLTFTIGSGSPSQQCIGTTDASGNAHCTLTLTLTPGGYPLMVSFAGDAGFLPSSDQRRFLAVVNVPSTRPVSSGISPHGGSTCGGTTVTIVGTRFSGATAVSFGGKAATSFSVVDAKHLTAVSPGGSGMVDITVTTPAGTSPVTAADQFTYDPAVVVSGISPHGGPSAGGTTVTVVGRGFSTGNLSVSFGGTPAPNVTPISDTTFKVVAPPGSGVVDIIVTTAAGSSAATSADKFTYH